MDPNKNIKSVHPNEIDIVTEDYIGNTCSDSIRARLLDETTNLHSIRFDSIRFDSIRFDSIRFDSIQVHVYIYVYILRDNERDRDK